MNVIIASDFHLKFEPDKNEKLRLNEIESFLNSWKGKADILILNGDIFDLWFEWKRVIIKGYFSFYRTLAELRESGCRIVYIAGNHDFWLGDFLKNEIGCETYSEYYTADIDGKKIFVAHGDQYTTNDLRYQIFRSLVRSKLVMWFFGLIHPDFALDIGIKMSRSSRRVKIPLIISRRRENGLLEFARKRTKVYDFVILGHSHKLCDKKFTNGTYLNSGDWLENRSYIQIYNGNYKLKKWKSTEEK